MPGRRRVLDLRITAASLTAAGAAYAAAGTGGGQDYEEAAQTIWRWPGLPDPSPEHRLIHVATLAANSHNTQPWRFSLGCAVENIVQAAQAGGAEALPAYNARGNGIDVEIRPAVAREAPSAAAIAQRQSARADYDGLFSDGTGNPVVPDLVGRAFQRFALQTTATDLKLSLLNCPIQVAAIRP